MLGIVQQETTPQEIVNVKNMLIEKREKFTIQIRRQQRENLYKLRRNVHVQQDSLPLFSQNFINLQFKVVQQLEHIYNTANSIQIDKDYKFEPSETFESYIEHLIFLEKYLLIDEIDQKFQSETPINVIFSVLGKGLPKIDLLCINILKEFSMPTYSTQLPLFQKNNFSKLLIFLQNNEYNQILESSLILLRNLAADSSELRNLLLDYDIIEFITQLIKQRTMSIPLIIEIIWMFFNIAIIEPVPSHLYLQRLYDPLHYILVNFGTQVSISDSVCFRNLLFTLKTAYRRNYQTYIECPEEVGRKLVAITNDGLLPQIQKEMTEIFNVLSWISKEVFSYQLQEDIVRSIILSTKNIIKRGLRSTEQQTRTLSKICLNANIGCLTNYAADGNQIVNIILADNEFLNMLLNLEIQKSQVKTTLYELMHFYDILLKGTTNKQLIQLIEINDYALLRQVMMMMLIDNEDDIKLKLSGIEVILSIFLGYQEQINSMYDAKIKDSKIFKVFEDEGGETMLYNLEQHRSQEVYKKSQELYYFIE